MPPKNYSDLDKRERDARWRDAHQQGRDEIKAKLMEQGKSESAAYREADRIQTAITNEGRANYRRGDGKD